MPSFNPSRDLLGVNQRLYLNHKHLYVEEAVVRKKSSFFTRLFTRSHYSQNAILKSMHRLAKKALAENVTSQ
jgi:hypothetical protein